MVENMQVGERVILTTKSNVIKSGIYLGNIASPFDSKGAGILMSPSDKGNLLEWISSDYISELASSVEVGETDC